MNFTHGLVKAMDLEQYTDEQIVNGILDGERPVIEYFFYRECTPVFIYIVRNLFDCRVDINELISEFYLYLSENDWYKIRQFDYRSRLLTWIRVVAIRFAQKKREELIGNPVAAALIEKGYNPNGKLDRKLDIANALQKMWNPKYREVIDALDLREVHPRALAERMGVSVDNLYNIHRRARLQLALIMRKEDYYD